MKELSKSFFASLCFLAFLCGTVQFTKKNIRALVAITETLRPLRCGRKDGDFVKIREERAGFKTQNHIEKDRIIGPKLYDYGSEIPIL